MNVLNRTLLLAGLLATAVLAQAQEARTTAPGPFDRIDIGGIARVELQQADRDEVTVVGDEEVQRAVELTVSDGLLRIRHGDSWRFWNRDAVQVRVRMRELTQLTISGASDVHAPRTLRLDSLSLRISGQGLARLDDLQANRLRFDVSGAGDAMMAGQVQELRVSVSGKSRVQAERLKAARAHLSISGLCTADVWVTDELRASVSGIGTINYWGQPKVQRSSSGLANINPRGERP